MVSTAIPACRKERDDPSLVKLLDREKAVARRPVDGSGNQNSGGSVRAQHLGGQAALCGEIADVLQFFHT